MPPQLELESTLVDVDSASRFFFTVVVLGNERDDVIAVADVEDCADADEAVAANDKHAAATATIAVRDLPNFIINTALYHVKLTRIRGHRGLSAVSLRTRRTRYATTPRTHLSATFHALLSNHSAIIQ